MIDPQALAKDSLIEAEFLQELKANDMSEASLSNYRRAVDTLSEIGKDPADMDKKDLVKWSADLRDRYAESTVNLYKVLVKRYFKWLHTGDLHGGEYPDCIKWMKTKNSSRNLPKEILSHKEVKRMAKTATRQRDRAMIWTGYESGCRPGELLGMRIRDIEFDKYGAKVHVDGKTGERVIRLVESVPDLKLWISMHPKSDDLDAPLWWSRQGGGLALGTWEEGIQKLAKKAGIEKHVHPHLLRHSRATHLTAQGVNEAQLREIFGWTKNSDMPSIYVHLSGRDTDSTILKLYGMNVKSSENQLEMSVKECPFCGHENSPNARFCNECNAPLDSIAAERSDGELRMQEKLTQKIVQRLIEKAPEMVEEVLSEEDIKSELRERSEVAAI